MKKKIAFFVMSVMIATVLCLSLTACTVSVNDPSITDDKTELESLQIKAENGTWQNVSEGQAVLLFDMVKGFGELTSEPLDVAISGNSTIDTEYDYSFKMAFRYGNFFMRKRGEFTYNVGEKFTRTSSDGKVSERYRENILIVKRSLSKDTATLTDAQLKQVQEIFESVNYSVMSTVFEKVAVEARAAGYTVDVIPEASLADIVFNLCDGMPLNAQENLLKGYKISTGSETDYLFFTASEEWAKEWDKWSEVSRVGRVCYIAGAGFGPEIKNILQS